LANLERIVNVSIALNTAGISKLGFNDMCIVGTHALSLNRVDTITSTDELITMGFNITDPIYNAVTSALSQTPRIKQVKIGRIAPATSIIKVKTISATAIYSATISSKVSGSVVAQTYSYTSISADATAILTGLLAAITADTDEIVTGVVADSTLTLTPTDDTNFKVTVSDNLVQTFGTATETIAESMVAITTEDNDFYGIILADRTVANIQSMASWVETHTKLFLTSTAEAGAIDVVSTTDAAYLLKDDNYYRTSYWYHGEASTEYIDAAIMARCFMIDAGGENWSLKSLAGVSTDKLTETQFNAVKAKNGNTFENVRNITVTQNGKVAAGEWIDVIRFRDWLQEEIATNVFTAMKNKNKVGYIDAGIAIIEAQVRKGLDDGVTVGGIAPTEYDADGNKNPSYVLTVPLASEITATVKATRVLSGILFTARLAGAINATNINGSLTYENLTTTDNVA
jgi:hypothetical protein